MTTRQQLLPVLPRLGRHINHDDRSKAYPAAALLADTAKPRTKTWRRGQAYDQRQNPWCVAYAGKGVLNTAPESGWVPYRLRSAYDPAHLYAGAQANDEFPGAAYDGTSGLGLCRFLAKIGRVREYRWCFTLDDYLLALSYVGPIGFGTWWKDTMWDTDTDGFLDPSGANVGGHEVELFGVNVEHRYVEGMNSWGTTWGDRGRFRLTFDALEQLIAEKADGFLITA